MKKIQIENTNIRMWSLKKYILLNFKFKIQERLSKNNYEKKLYNRKISKRIVNKVGR